MNFRIVTLRDTMIRTYLVKKNGQCLNLMISSLRFSDTKGDVLIHMYLIQARSVVIFSSTHKYIWSRNLSKLSEKYCVLYFLFEVVVWIQAKYKASCPYFEQTWRKQNIVLVVVAWLELPTTFLERRSFAKKVLGTSLLCNFAFLLHADQTTLHCLV